MKAMILNGDLFEGKACEAVSIPASDRGFLLGDGLFETLPVINGKALWWSDHKERLLKSAKILALPVHDDGLDACVSQLSALAKEEQAILRIALSRGSGGRGLLPPATPDLTCLATLAPLPAGLAFADATLATSAIRRNEHSVTATIKSNNYLDNIIAAQQAGEKGADDALLLNTAGAMACTTIGNLFAIFGKTLKTPPISDGVLPGIMRAKILQFAQLWALMQQRKLCLRKI